MMLTIERPTNNGQKRGMDQLDIEAEREGSCLRNLKTMAVQRQGKKHAPRTRISLS